MRITKTVGYECEFCNNTHSNKSNIIEITGQYGGRSDLIYELHFCDRDCLNQELCREELENPDNEEYIYILQEELMKIWK